MDLLDEADYIKEQYFLEVSSPGIERVIRRDRHFNGAIGEKIEVNLFKPQYGKKCLEGILTGYDETLVIMMCENDEISIPRKNISLIKTKYDWN